MRTHARSSVEVLRLAQLTATITHELKEPLTAIGAEAAACTNWLTEAPADLDEVRASLAAIHREVQRAALHPPGKRRPEQRQRRDVAEDLPVEQERFVRGAPTTDALEIEVEPRNPMERTRDIAATHS